MKNQRPQKNMLISTVRARRKALLQAGLTRSELTMLEEIALQMKDNRLRFLKGAYLAACLGVSSQWANTLLRRLDRLGLITRLKTGLMRLNLEKLKEIRPTLAKVTRRKVSKWLKTKVKSERRNYGVHDKGNIYSDNRSLSQRHGIADANGSLVDGYVPVNLRKVRT